MANFRDLLIRYTGSCRFFGRMVRAMQDDGPILSQVKEELGSDVKVVKIDVDRNRGLAEAYQVQGVPTLMIFKQGKMVWRQSGVQQASELIARIQSIAS